MKALLWRVPLLLSLVSLSDRGLSFPTADSLVDLAQREGLTPDQIHRKVLDIKKRIVLDPLSKPIQVDGEHAFEAPDLEGGDERGPCPGLNALANHGYLPRHGVAGFFETIETVNTVFGMGIDIGTVLATLGTVGVGNPLSLKPSYSIGGVSRRAQNLLGNLFGLLGTPRGLDGSHNLIEPDASFTRDDLYVTGDASTMNMELFMKAYNSIDGVMTMKDVGDHSARRVDESIATNPDFFYGPYNGLLVRNAAYAFGGRLLSNHSREFPYGGRLDKETFKSFWGVYDREDGSLEYRRGWERIPNGWYRYGGEYGLVQGALDIVSWVLQHPRLANIGGNLGEVNSFAGVDLGNITGGVLNSVSLLEDNNLVCFALHIVETFAPNSLSSLFKSIRKPLQMINDALLDPLLDLDCPAFDELEAGGKDILAGLLDKYPGAKKSGYAF